MARFIFWIKKFINGKDIGCKCFCVTCEHYEECREDGGIDE